MKVKFELMNKQHTGVISESVSEELIYNKDAIHLMLTNMGYVKVFFDNDRVWFNYDLDMYATIID